MNDVQSVPMHGRRPAPDRTRPGSFAALQRKLQPLRHHRLSDRRACPADPRPCSAARPPARPDSDRGPLPRARSNRRGQDRATAEFLAARDTVLERHVALTLLQETGAAGQSRAPPT